MLLFEPKSDGTIVSKTHARLIPHKFRPCTAALSQSLFRGGGIVTGRR